MVGKITKPAPKAAPPPNGARRAAKKPEPKTLTKPEYTLTPAAALGLLTLIDTEEIGCGLIVGKRAKGGVPGIIAEVWRVNNVHDQVMKSRGVPRADQNLDGYHIAKKDFDRLRVEAAKEGFEVIGQAHVHYHAASIPPLVDYQRLIADEIGIVFHVAAGSAVLFDYRTKTPDGKVKAETRALGAYQIDASKAPIWCACVELMKATGYLAACKDEAKRFAQFGKPIPVAVTQEDLIVVDFVGNWLVDEVPEMLKESEIDPAQMVEVTDALRDLKGFMKHFESPA